MDTFIFVMQRILYFLMIPIVLFSHVTFEPWSTLWPKHKVWFFVLGVICWPIGMIARFTTWALDQLD